jgi:hypothetical protein
LNFTDFPTAHPPRAEGDGGRIMPLKDFHMVAATSKIGNAQRRIKVYYL